jgi:uncharacterized protein (DUF1697 family)
VATQIALLRGINVGGHKPVAMADLRALLAGLGFGEPRTLLQSGNLVFRGDAPSDVALERLLEAEVERRLGLATQILVRSAEEWDALIAANPFPDAAEHDPGHLLLMPLKAAPAEQAVDALRAASTGPELIRVAGKQAYLVYPEGIGRSKLTNALIERTLGTRGTGRNWNTVLKLAALARA